MLWQTASCSTALELKSESDLLKKEKKKKWKQYFNYDRIYIKSNYKTTIIIIIFPQLFYALDYNKLFLIFTWITIFSSTPQTLTHQNFVTGVWC